MLEHEHKIQQPLLYRSNNSSGISMPEHISLMGWQWRHSVYITAATMLEVYYLTAVNDINLYISSQTGACGIEMHGLRITMA